MAEEISIADLKGGFKNANSTSGKPPKLPREEAQYVLEMRGARLFLSEDPRTKGDPVFSCDFKVRATSTGSVSVNSLRSWTQNLKPYDKKVNYGMDNVKQLVCSLFGFMPGTPEAEEIDDEHLQMVLDGETRGFLVNCTTVPKGGEDTQKHPWVLLMFEPYDGDLEAGDAEDAEEASG